MKKSIFVVLFLVLYAFSAYATLFSGNTEPVADCFVPAQETYTLLNDSSTAQTYVISATGEQKEWVNLEGRWIHENPLQVSLAPHTSKQLFAFLKPQNCYVEPGEYPITITGKAENAFSTRINLTVVPIRTITISSTATVPNIGQCEETTIPLIIENTGESNELVELAVAGIPPEWTRFSEHEFVLEKGRSRELELFIAPGCTAETGRHPFNIKAFLSGTSFFAQQEMQLMINQTQTISASNNTLKNISACNDAETTHAISITNDGNREDTLQLRLTGEKWASLAEDRLTLKPQETKDVPLLFAKTDANTGTSDFALTVYSETFNQTFEFPFTVTLEDCYGSTVEHRSINTEAYEPGMPVCIEDPVVAEVIYHNAKNKELTISVSVADANAAVSPQTLTLEPGKTGRITARLSFTGEEPGEKTFSVNADAPQFSDSQQFKVTAVDCFALSVDYSSLAGRIDVNAESQEAYTIKLKNTGTRELNVKAHVTGPPYVYVQPETRLLKPGEEEGIFLYVSPPFDTPEGEKNATLAITARDFSDSRDITFNVYGGLYALVGDVHLRAASRVADSISLVERTITLDVNILNDGNALVNITGVRAIDYNAHAAFQKTTLAPGESMVFPVTLTLPPGFNKEQFVVPLSFQTDKGAIVKSIGVDLTKTAPISIGFISLGDARDTAIILLALVIVALIVIIALRTKDAEETAPEAESKAAAKPKKLAEKKKK